MAIHERSGNLSIWWFPREFCQSRLGEYRRHGSNSCTLIALIVANRVSAEERGFFHNANELPARAVDMFAAAINDGNRAYRYAMRPGVSATEAGLQSQHKYKDMFQHGSDTGHGHKAAGSENLNIPDAINVLHADQHVDFHLSEWFYTHLRAEPRRNNYTYTVAARLTRIMLLTAELFRQAQATRSKSSSGTGLRYLFAAMIADSRTVMFVIELPVNVVTVFDSHQHGVQLGAMVAQCELQDLDELLQWNMNMVYEMYGSRPEIYEVSFLTTSLSGLPQPHLLDKLMLEQMEGGAHHKYHHQHHQQSGEHSH